MVRNEAHLPQNTLAGSRQYLSSTEELPCLWQFIFGNCIKIAAELLARHLKFKDLAEVFRS